MSRPIISLRNEDTILLGWISYEINDFAFAYDTYEESKEIEEFEKYQDLSRELKNLRNMAVDANAVIMGTPRVPNRIL